MPNWVWAVLVLLTLAVATYVTVRVNKKALFVSALHNGIWAGAIALLGSNLIAYNEAATWAWLTLILGLVGFNAGVWCSRFLAPKSFEMADSLESAAVLSLVSRRVLLVVTLIYAGAFAFYLTTIQLRFGIGSILFDPVSIRASREPSYLEAVPLPVRLLLYLGPLLFAIYGFKPAVSRALPLWFRLSAMLALALSMLALLQRTNLFMGLLLLIALLLTQPRPGSTSVDKASTEPAANKIASSVLGRYSYRTRLIAGVLVIGLVAFGTFQLIGGALRKDGSQASSTGAVAPVLEDSGLLAPFIYYTSGVAAFLQLTSSTNEEYPPESFDEPILVGDYNPQSWGARTFGPILKLIPSVALLPDNSAFIETPIWTNVFTWLEDFYRDFRGAGVAVGTLILGFMTSALYLRRERSARAYWLQATLISTIFLATFGPKYNDTLLLAELGFIALITLRFRRAAIRWNPGLGLRSQKRYLGDK